MSSRHQRRSSCRRARFFRSPPGRRVPAFGEDCVLGSGRGRPVCHGSRSHSRHPESGKRPHYVIARKTSHEPSIPTQLAKAGWSKDDVDLFELNEAFAAQSIAVIRELELDERKVRTPAADQIPYWRENFPGEKGG